MRGCVVADGSEAVWSLRVFDPGRAGTSPRVLEAVIDTGFTDRLTLPAEVVEALGLPLRGSALTVVLADGSIETLPIYRVRLLWHGRERAVRTYGTAGGPLVGMALLSGSELRVRVVENGPVEIEELP